MKKQQTFEAAIERLEEIVGLMDSDKIKLEDSIDLFSEGAKLIDFCNKSLDSAQQKIEEILPSGVENQNEK